MVRCGCKHGSRKWKDRCPKSLGVAGDGDPNLGHAGGGCHPALLMGGRAAHPKTRGLHEMHMLPAQYAQPVGEPLLEEVDVYSNWARWLSTHSTSFWCTPIGRGTSVLSRKDLSLTASRADSQNMSRNSIFSLPRRSYRRCRGRFIRICRGRSPRGRNQQILGIRETLEQSRIGTRASGIGMAQLHFLPVSRLDLWNRRARCNALKTMCE